MAYIRKLTDKPRRLPWRAQVRRKGHKVLVRMFATKSEAEHWAQEQERTIRMTGLPQTIDELKKHTVGDLVRRYLKEVTPTKGCKVSEASVLKRFLRESPLSSKSLAYITRQDAYQYRDKRLTATWKGKPVKAGTPRRELNSIQHIFEVAREQWGFGNLDNPFRGIEVKGSNYRRRRRLLEGELDALLNACQECRGLNEYYVPLAIYLAVETGMRLDEMFNLVWRDWDWQKRRIEIRKSKTDNRTATQGRTIVATPLAEIFLNRLAIELLQAERFKLDDRIFPMTKGAFQQSWRDVRKRAGIEGLQIRDLRREAGSRFDEAGLTKGEHDLMMGHANRDMRSVYVNSDLRPIQRKLDEYTLGGKSREQLEQELIGKGLQKLAGHPYSQMFIAALHKMPPEEALVRLMSAGFSSEEKAKRRELFGEFSKGYQKPSPVPDASRTE